MQGTVLRAQSGFFWVQTGAGLLECTLRGRLKKDRQASDIAVIGDVVEVAQTAPRHGAIEMSGDIGHQHTMLGNREGVVAAGLAVPARHASQAMGDVLDLDVER